MPDNVSIPETRTAAEVLAYKTPGTAGLFGFDREALIEFLSFDEARPWLTPEATADDWPEPAPRTRDGAVAAIADYLGRVGLDKAVNHRGLSAGRTLEKMRAWCWLSGDAEAVAICDEKPYPQYGAPVLMALCEHFKLDWRAMLTNDYDRGVFEDQAAGRVCRSCVAGNDSGCGL